MSLATESELELASVPPGLPHQASPAGSSIT